MSLRPQRDHTRLSQIHPAAATTATATHPHRAPASSPTPTLRQRNTPTRTRQRRTPKRPATTRKRGAEEAMLNSAQNTARATRARTPVPDEHETHNSSPSGGPSERAVSALSRVPPTGPLAFCRAGTGTGTDAVTGLGTSTRRVSEGISGELNAAILHHFDPTYKRIRSSADSDAGSSSCKDMDEPEVYAPDSIAALIDQLRKLIYYVESKPALAHGSASFMRDYLRTMLLENSIMSQEVIAAAAKAHKKDVMAGRKPPAEHFKQIPEELAKHIFSFLDGYHLARAREVCKKWNDFAVEDPLWKALCLKKWKSLDTDEHLWRLISRNIPRDAPNRWRRLFPIVQNSPRWNCRLQKTGKFICNLIAHQISGSTIGDLGLPAILVVERRFNILHLQTFVLPDAAVLYFEPETEKDREGFNDFIDYLNRRTRAGLALEDQRRFIFIPPCEYTRTQVEYHGNSLLGVVQNAYPPLAP